VECIQNIAAAMKLGDWFLLGADRIKDKSVLDAAYNDAQGFTARFNLNVLRVLNRELAADFDLQRFVHEAFYDPDRCRIEMHLRAIEPHRVRLAALAEHIEFEPGETILTEISRKFSASDLETLLAAGGLTVRKHYEAADAYFSLVLAERN
ncbi:MAG: L-histidine N(alpha)-methyltransferase, partial [Gammaproteobacteria bacterium]|nr:L-histidine N(alpha)-methyltransferase [Gammaproteobacteria bacterium]